jgi:hypothetical protein
MISRPINDSSAAGGVAPEVTQGELFIAQNRLRGLLRVRENKMRLAIIAAIVTAFILGFFARPLYATGYVRTDGVWWNGLSAGAKPNVVAGMLSSFREGYNVGIGYSMALVSEDPKSSNDALVEKLDKMPAPAFSKRLETYVDEIDGFYSDHPEMVRKVPAETILGCLDDNAARNCISSHTKVYQGKPQ